MTKNIVEILYASRDTCRFVLDSGAFTAWKSGKPIVLDDYCRFIETLPFRPWKYFALDVIGDPEATMKNYQIMLDRGLTPIPIFTRGDDIKVIDEYYKTSDVVGLGGLVGTPGNKGYVKSIMRVIGNRKVHWLGFTNFNFIHHYKPYMCDSSSFAAGVRYARISLFFEPNIWVNFGKSSDLSKYAHLIREYGFDPLLFKNKHTWVNSGSGKNAIEYINILSHVRYQHYLYKKYNTLYFMATAGTNDLSISLQGTKYLQTRGLIK